MKNGRGANRMNMGYNTQSGETNKENFAFVVWWLIEHMVGEFVYNFIFFKTNCCWWTD